MLRPRARPRRNNSSPANGSTGHIPSDAKKIATVKEPPATPPKNRMAPLGLREQFALT